MTAGSRPPARSGAERRWFFYEDASGKTLMKDEWAALGTRDGRSVQIRVKLQSLMDRYKTGELRGNGVDDLGDGLRELRIKIGTNPYRLIFFNWGSHMVALTCFYKNQQKTPRSHILQAKRRREDWTSRHGANPPR